VGGSRQAAAGWPCCDHAVERVWEPAGLWRPLLTGVPDGGTAEARPVAGATTTGRTCERSWRQSTSHFGLGMA